MRNSAVEKCKLSKIFKIMKAFDWVKISLVWNLLSLGDKYNIDIFDNMSGNAVRWGRGEGGWWENSAGEQCWHSWQHSYKPVEEFRNMEPYSKPGPHIMGFGCSGRTCQLLIARLPTPHPAHNVHQAALFHPTHSPGWRGCCCGSRCCSWRQCFLYADES